MSNLPKAFDIDLELNILTLSYDSVCEDIKELEEQKQELRSDLIELYNMALKRDFPHIEDPTNENYQFVNPINNLVYKKSVAEVGTKFEAEKYLKDNGETPFIKSKTVFSLDEKAAEKACREEPDLYARLAAYTVTGKKQVRIYQGTKATESDL